MFAFKFVCFLLFSFTSLFLFASNSTVSSQITLCKLDADAFESIPLTSIRKIEVLLYELNKTEFKAEYTGNSIPKVLEPLNLNSPEHMGSVGTILTGKIILYFQLGSDPQARIKILDIENSRMIEDEECIGVAYFPSRKLDRSWLPEN